MACNVKIPFSPFVRCCGAELLCVGKGASVDELSFNPRV